MQAQAMAPRGVNHLVINVRNMAESHRFWTEVIGFQRVGTGQHREGDAPPRAMAFYSGQHEGRLTHHDIALVEYPELPAPAADGTVLSAINHIGIAYPDRETWLRQLSYLQSIGVKFERRIEHGMSRSLYIRDPNGYGVELLYELPRHVWEGNIQAALDHHITLPHEGPDALVDRAEPGPVFLPKG
jgi:catechol 2,3-dioxygenase-like lactoylglutathione lyase family enzyme